MARSRWANTCEKKESLIKIKLKFRIQVGGVWSPRAPINWPYFMAVESIPHEKHTKEGDQERRDQERRDRLRDIEIWAVGL